jgi:phage baseplate assembly protein V
VTAIFGNRPLHVRLNGAPLDAILARHAVSAFVRQALNAPALAELVFADPSVDSLSSLALGQGLAIAVEGGGDLFEGEITAIEYEHDAAQGRIVRLRALDKLHRARLRQRARTLTDLSAIDLAGQLASELGLAFQSAEQAPTRALIVQHDQSDFDLLVDLARDAGLYLYLTAGTLHLVSLAGEGDPIPLRMRRELIEARATAGAESLRRWTGAQAWDPSRAVAASGRAGLARQDVEELRDGGLTAFPDLGGRTLFNRLGVDEAEIESLAQADLDRAVARAVLLEAVVEGDIRLAPGRPVTIEGIGDLVDGRCVITRALHRFDEARGYVVEISTEPPARADRARAPAFTLGKVTDADDPAGLARVRATLPVLGDVETGWMSVLSQGAGADKGVSILPEPDDDVLVLFPDGDPARGVVLGGLYGERIAPGRPGARAAGARAFTIRTPGGQALTLDSVEAMARLQTRAGGLFEFSAGGSRLRASGDLLIEAPGRKLTIRAASVAFEEG